MSHKMYFITGGVIIIYHETTRTVYTNLKNKNYFGEISFFLETKRSASAQCKEFSDLLSVSRSDLLYFLEKFPETAQRVEDLVESCKDMDYSKLGVKCYICDELGHIANQCKSVILNIDQGEVKEKWLEQKEIRKTVRVNTKSFPKYVRNKRKVKMGNMLRHSVLGENLMEFSNDEELAKAIQKAENVVIGLEAKAENQIVVNKEQQNFLLI